MEKVTKRDFYEYLKSVAEQGYLEAEDETEGRITNEMIVDFCANEIDLLNKKAEKAKENALKKNASNDALSEKIKEVLTEEFEPIAVITEKVNDPDATVAKVTYRLTQLYKKGFAEKKEIEIPKDEEGLKPRKVQGYRKASVENE